MCKRLLNIIIAFLIIFLIVNEKGASQSYYENAHNTVNTHDTKTVSNNSPIENQIDFNNEGISLSRHNAITEAVKISSPAIVGINITEVHKIEYRHPILDDPFFGRFFGNQGGPRYRQYEVQGLGSGFIISPDGYILTNHHVAGNASKIVISTTDGEKYDAEIIGSDRVSDVALLKIKGNNLPYLKLSNSDDVLTGEWVIAFGNPFGLFKFNAKPTVTVGVVSNKGINMIQEGIVYKDLIQTDAAISSGNSGGPLVNALGEVIGMNTMIFSTAQDQRGAGSIGIGFAIPINRVKNIVDILKNNKTINRNFVIGMEVKEIDERIAKYLNTDIKEGAVIFSINRRSPAEDAGFEPGDIIQEINGNKILRADDYYINIYDGIAGQSMDVSILRGTDKMIKKLLLKPI